MNILVYDVAAENRGAVSILEHYYKKHLKDKDNHYYYLLSVYNMDDADNITVINVPEVKKSWGRRLLFDLFGVGKYIKKYKIDNILSLQNTIIPLFLGPQTVYEQNALPFSEHRFKISEDMILWIYQNVIDKYMIWSIKKASKVIVQTEWMKDAIIRKTLIDPLKIEVDFPAVEIPDGHEYCPVKPTTFFYPANAAIYKNHKVIIDACRILKDRGIVDFRIIFTLVGDETANVETLKREMTMLGVDIIWNGPMTREKVFEHYRKSILLFSSYIETVGLPIYEAMNIGSPMILSDCLYSRDIAKDYEKVHFFEYDDAEELADIMEELIHTT